MSGFECLADLIINDDGVSARDAGYVCFLCNADVATREIAALLEPRNSVGSE